MSERSALRRLSQLDPGTEIWWDSSPLVFDRWRQGLSQTWHSRPELLAALDELDFASLSGVLRGCTTNPPLALEALESDRDGWLRWARSQRPTVQSAQSLAWALYREVLRRGAQQVLPLWEQSEGRVGQICGQVDPRLLHDRDAMVQQGIELAATCPNVMVKMPATEAGIDGICLLSALGISTNATLGFSVSQIMATARAASAGMAAAQAQGLDLSRTRSMATLMLGRMEDAPAFAAQAAAAGIDLSEVDRRWAGVAVARKAYRLLEEQGLSTKLLLASMRLGPTQDGVTRIWHLEQLAGGNTVLTIFPNILASFIETYAERDLEPCIQRPVPEEILERLLRVPYFRSAYEESGVVPAEYANLPGVAATGSAFVEAMRSIDSLVQILWDTTG